MADVGRDWPVHAQRHGWRVGIRTFIADPELAAATLSRPVPPWCCWWGTEPVQRSSGSRGPAVSGLAGDPDAGNAHDVAFGHRGLELSGADGRLGGRPVIEVVPDGHVVGIVRGPAKGVASHAQRSSVEGVMDFALCVVVGDLVSGEHAKPWSSSRYAPRTPVASQAGSWRVPSESK